VRNKRNAAIWTGIALLLVLVFGFLLINDIGKAADHDDVVRPLSFLNPQGEKAQSIYDLMIPVFLVAGVVFILVEVGLIWLARRFRRADDDVDGVEEPKQVHGNTKLEIGWTVAPALVLAVLAVFNVQTLLSLDDAEDPIDITVAGQQWWWEYRYDLDGDGEPDIITATEAAIPVNRDIRFNIQSNDVIHSFWIPSLNGKMDAVPGRTHQLIMDATSPGVYEGQCTEYCGLSHGVMRMQVKALEQDEYDAWIEEMTTVPDQPEDELAQAGQELFVTQCTMCHQINGIVPPQTAPFEYSTQPDPAYGDTVGQPTLARNAPNLTHFMMRTKFVGGLLDLYETDPGPVARPWEHAEPNINNIKHWLREPLTVKPMNPENNQGMPDYNLSEEQIDQLTAFLITLR
jgi:cytochrome c oxidase subunit II